MNKYVFILVFLLCSIQQLFAQKGLIQLTQSELIETIHSVNNIITENYIFPDISNKISVLLETNLNNGFYTSTLDPIQLANILTKDIQSFNGDKHLRVLYEPERIAKNNLVFSTQDSINANLEMNLKLKANNYYFKELNILDGNIGYLDLRKFSDPYYAGETAISAMNFLSNSDAIIIDLRNNGGGYPQMVQLLASYFFDNEAVLLNTVYKRKENMTKQFWTLPNVSGKRMPTIPLFILTSNRTFSAAEEFCYNLQSLKRATIIGEITGGGAHPGGRIMATKKFNVWTPTARSINPITMTNWEQVGVMPDIKTTADEAFKTAYVKVLELLISKNATSTDYTEILDRIKNSN